MTISDMYEMTRTDDMPTQVLSQRLGRHSHPYSEAAEYITRHEMNPDYKPKHRKTAEEIREAMS